MQVANIGSFIGEGALKAFRELVDAIAALGEGAANLMDLLAGWPAPVEIARPLGACDLPFASDAPLISATPPDGAAYTPNRPEQRPGGYG